MNHGRYYHSTCAFENRWIYAFAGVQSKTKTYFNSIERLDTQESVGQTAWELIDVSEMHGFTMRQGQGCAQLDKDSIVVFGGFNGSFLDDAFVFSHGEKMMVKLQNPCPTSLFCY